MSSSTSAIDSVNTTRVHKRRPSGLRLRRNSTRDTLSPICDGESAPSSTLTAPKLAKLRAVILDYLKELEAKLAQVEPRLRELWEERLALSSGNGGPPGPASALGFRSAMRPRSESFSASAIAEARARIIVGIEMLKRIRADVSSHLPELPLVMLENFFPDFTTSMHMLPEFELPCAPHEMMTFEHLQAYLPTLRVHLESLHEHLRAVQLPSSLSIQFPTAVVHGKFSELLNKLQDPDLLTDPLKGLRGFLGEGKRDKGEMEEEQVRRALEKSAHGDRLILYTHLPERYKNNDYVVTGYRFIPLHRWPRLIFSIFQFHNETANIWTHLAPLLLSLSSLSSLITQVLESTQSGHQLPVDIAEHVFTLFANICLLSSCVWHVMSGCAHMGATETAARLDYVGIGWLITASIGSVIYYGFSCRPVTAASYLIISFLFGMAASILPFMAWFNDRNHKSSRIIFFVCLVFTVLLPLAHLAAIHSLWDMYIFIRSEFPSLAVYIIGLLFYAFRFPECVIPCRWTWVSDWVGGGSHAVWHLCIVLGIKLHRDAMVEYRNGIADETCEFSLLDSAARVTAVFRR